MDSLSGKCDQAIAFGFSELTADRRNLREPWEIYLGIVATLTISSNGQPVLAEQLFSVVELAIEMCLWCESGMELGRDFTYRSMESEMAGLIWINLQPNDLYVVSSFNLTHHSVPVKKNELATVISEFYRNLRIAVENEFKKDIDKVLSWRRQDLANARA